MGVVLVALDKETIKISPLLLSHLEHVEGLHDVLHHVILLGHLRKVFEV